MTFSTSCSSKAEDERDSSLQWKGKIMCLYGDSTLDIIELSDNLKKSLELAAIYNRSVPGCGYLNGPVNSVYYFTARADTAYRLRYGDPVNDPDIDYFSLPKGCEKIDAHQYSVKRINTIPLVSDLVLIGGGINDVTYINEASDYSSFEDCVIATVKIIKSRCPKAKLFILGPSPSKQILDNADYWKKAILIDNTIKAIAQSHNIPYYSLLDNLGWNSANILDYTDGVHPNTEIGYRWYANAIIEFIISNFTK